MDRLSTFPEAGRARLLVVDDDSESRAMLTQMLRDHGHAVETAEDGYAAVINASLYPPALILMDGDMPLVDGFEACRILKSHARTRAVPVLMVTGFADRDHRLRAHQVGCDGFLAKPVDGDDLEARIRSALRA